MAELVTEEIEEITQRQERQEEIAREFVELVRESYKLLAQLKETLGSPDDNIALASSLPIRNELSRVEAKIDRLLKRADELHMKVEDHPLIQDLHAERKLLAMPHVLLSELPEETRDLPLIRLPRSDGQVQVPDFQFATDGSPRQAILEVNEVMGASDDPWAVCQWWQLPNGRLYDSGNSQTPLEAVEAVEAMRRHNSDAGNGLAEMMQKEIDEPYPSF